MPVTLPITWSNPENINLSEPFIYLIVVKSSKNEYRYVGKGSKASRLDAYGKNVKKILEGNPKRPLIKRNGETQSEGNIKFRYVHLVLATAVKNGWGIQHTPIRNCSKEEHSQVEQACIEEYQCNMNSGKSWFVEDFKQLSSDIS